MIDRLTEICSVAERQIAETASTAELDELKIKVLGRKAELPNLLRSVADLDPAQRAEVGKAGNKLRGGLERAFQQRKNELARAELDARLKNDVIDVTLPAVASESFGRLHVLTSTQREIEDIFLGFGFTILDGPQIESTYYNFDALNHDPHHPARRPSDTFYLTDELILRTQTSPMQIRAMQQTPPPLYVVVPGRVYRPDSDATHTPQFHQVEGLAVDEDITLADLQGILLSFSQAIFGGDRKIRLRPHYFPFTEPSVEVDVSCFKCREGWLKDGTRCNLCKGTAWIEILGAGMVDPNVFEYVRESGYDPEKVQGFAWGMGIDRIAMLKHGISDLRLLFDNDLRLLEQFR